LVTGEKMKISVCGKGGSGKSTIATLLANEAKRRGYRVLVVDSDESNSGLYRMLGFDQPPVPLMELLGGKKGLKEKMRQANVLAESEIAIDSIPEPYLLKRDGLMLVSIGKILQSLEGCACPMGVLSREFLKKVRLKEGEMVIADMAAGIEHFGRGVEASLDSVLMVVEPSFESLELSAKVNSLATGIGIKNIWAILNKVPSPDVASKLERELLKRNIDVIGCIPHDPEVFNSSLEGSTVKGGKAAEEIKVVLERILGKTKQATS
jgi:CO dehydrogenase maturation factor